MRSNMFLLAIGLNAASALAGPCKPNTSGKLYAVSTSGVATPEATTTAQSTPVEAVSYTSTLELSTPAVTIETTSVASEAEATTTDTTITDSTTTVDADTTTIASEAETIITEDITTTTAAESTSTAPESTPTYIIVGGSGSVNNDPIEGINQEGSFVIINPVFQGLTVRSYVLDTSTGRLQDTASGNYLCAYYGYSSTTSAPPYAANCQTGTTGPNNYYDYLNCQIVDGTVSCTAPRAYCATDDFGPDNCVTASGEGVNDQFYYQHRSSGGDYLFISTGSPNGYTPTSLKVQ